MLTHKRGTTVHRLVNWHNSMRLLDARKQRVRWCPAGHRARPV